MRMSRIEQLEQYILEHKSVSIDKLCEVFQISKNTVRRDLDVLVTRGNIEKVYGGVVACDTLAGIPELVSFNERNIKNREAKNQIAALAATYVREKDIIFIDTGTTTVGIVDHLSHLANVTVITYSIQVINRAMAYPNINLISLPGTLKRDTASLVGASCTDYLKDFNIVRAFMACTGISVQHGVCNASTEEYNIKKMALARSNKHYLLADSSKFEKSSLMTYGEISQFQYILTEMLPSDEFRAACREQGCRIQLAKKDEL